MKDTTMETRKHEQPTPPLQNLSPEQMRDITGGYNLFGGTFTFPDRTEGCGTMVLRDRMMSALRV